MSSFKQLTPQFDDGVCLTCVALVLINVKTKSATVKAEQVSFDCLLHFRAAFSPSCLISLNLFQSRLIFGHGNPYTRAHTPTYAHTNTHAHTREHTRAHTRTYAHTNTHVRTHALHKRQRVNCFAAAVAAAAVAAATAAVE